METILIVEDEPIDLAIAEEALKEDGYKLVVANCGSEAQEILSKDAKHIKAILLDYVMPGMTGLELLHWIKSKPELADIEVILQSGRIRMEDVKNAIDAGAHSYLAKPYQFPELRAAIRAAITSTELKHSLLEKIRQSEGAFRLLMEGGFEFQTLSEAEAMAAGIAATCDACREGMGILELLVNAVEHGNLGVTYEEKGALLADGIYLEEIERRLSLPENHSKQVEVRLKRHEKFMEVEIEDSGPGFNYQNYVDFDKSRLYDSHGRGILLAATLLDLEYVDPGNKVRVRIPIPAAGN